MSKADQTMQVRQVDERDSGWEESAPRFRVYLHGSNDDSTHGSTDTYDVTGADVLQVIDWAQRQAGDRLTYAVALVRDDVERERLNPGAGRGLVWLVGMDGNDTTDDQTPERAVQQRMLLRRRAPVGVPAADRAPDDVLGHSSDGSSRSRASASTNQWPTLRRPS
jgi:hypothetical protein